MRSNLRFGLKRLLARRPGLWILAALLFGLTATGLACGGGDGEKEVTPSPAAASPTETEPADGVTAVELAQAVVQILALDADGAAVWSGSGSLISADGMILTNAHVVDDRYGEYEVLGVALLQRTDEPPELTYLAQIMAVDYALDLAVIQIVADLEGEPAAVELPLVPVGDSDGVEIGDHIRILGYPGIGGETITFTDGVISGFTGERSIGGRAWIKTDATIAGGNSGGMAVNDVGELIGVPTIAGSGSEDEPVDCRLLADTNRDGIIDENDTCVPVGGFINGLRPVNLAAPLVSAVLSGETYVSAIAPEPEPVGGFETEQVILSNLVFADGVTENDEPTQLWDAIPPGVTAVCGFWDYEGMIDGMTWEALWFIDGELSVDGSITNDVWVGGDSGSWWACILDDLGLPDGLYELVLTVEDEPRGSAAIFVGGDHPPVAFDIDNASSEVICYAYLSPSGAQNWGFDVLRDTVIEAGQTFSMTIPAGTYDMLLQDCADNNLLEEYDLEIVEDSVYTVSDLP